MRREHLQHLACPDCKGDLRVSEVLKEEQSSIEEGTLECERCGRTYEVSRHIPRFVPAENYASGFGFQWNLMGQLQYDSHNGSTVSGDRFFDETGWPRDMQGEKILEVGSGAGRFTEHAISTGALVVSLDYSGAVDANFRFNGHHPNVLIVQGDVYALPFRPGYFDRVCCLGVLQHTPDVAKSFRCLPEVLRPGGSLVVDVYRRLVWWKQLLVTRYWVRPITRRMRPQRLYEVCRRYISFMWPITGWLRKLPFGASLSWSLLVADYRGVLPLEDDVLKDWALLDTFDMLSPAYDQPQTLETVRGWFEAGDFETSDVQYGYNGIQARGVKRSG